ncbi:hypothetical protein FB45DRAFT_959877 [Roridomyces roridus]|uniref:Uncharacterized protein n=1 Tax=Roridomyces roridus TaxID=1738132 RepID=A0AAD7AY00_9AGAR|nr:hypothetical protein FB45DRAFT_959877 [Roridomyces roridus]
MENCGRHPRAMCYETQYMREYSCGHSWGRNRQVIDCLRTACALSSRHDPAPHNCQQKCAQQMAAPVRVVQERFDKHCDRCILGG